MSLTLTLERGGGEVSGSGTNIELDGTIADGAIKSVEIYGDTEQTTYSGKNLVYTGQRTDSDLTWTYDSVTGIGNVKGTAGLTYSVADIIPVDIPSGTFTASIQQAISNAIIGVGYRVDGGSRATVPIYTNTTSSTKTLGGTKITTLDVYLTGLTVGTYYDITYKIQFESGSTATSFEPYVGGTASPNPDYPQAVQTVTGRQVVTVSDGGSESQEYEVNLGKNLLNPNTFVKGRIDSGVVGYASDTSALSNTENTITFTTTANYRGAASDFIEVDAETQYMVQQQLQSGTTNYIDFYDTSKTWISRAASNPFTTPQDCGYVRVSYQGNSAGTYTVTNLQLERGSSATTFAPYFTPIELCKIGDYQDYIYKSGEDWYVHKEIKKLDMSTITDWRARGVAGDFYRTQMNTTYGVQKGIKLYSNIFTYSATSWSIVGFGINNSNDMWIHTGDSTLTSQNDVPQWLADRGANMYGVMVTPTDTQITNEALIAQLDALNAGDTYEGTTVITVDSENLAGSLEVTAATNIAKTYTEVEIGSPFTITDVEGKSSNTTLDGNVYVDWAYNKKQYSFDLFNLTPQDYADIRAYYDYQFSNSAFPTITVPELNIDRLPVYMEISSRNIINQCLLTDKLTIKFRETVQP